MMGNCCHNGAFYNGELQDFKRLNPFPNQMHNICIEGHIHFARLSSTYNGILSLCSVGIDNQKGGHYENRQGAASVVMMGRTYSFIANAVLPAPGAIARPLSGVSYFAFDQHAQSAFNEHVRLRRNAAETNRQREQRKQDRRAARAAEFRRINANVVIANPNIQPFESDEEEDDDGQIKFPICLYQQTETFSTNHLILQRQWMYFLV